MLTQITSFSALHDINRKHERMNECKEKKRRMIKEYDKKKNVEWKVYNAASMFIKLKLNFFVLCTFYLLRKTEMSMAILINIFYIVRLMIATTLSIISKLFKLRKKRKWRDRRCNLHLNNKQFKLIFSVILSASP